MTHMLHQCSLMLEGITFAQMIELVIQVLVDLARGTIFDQETAEDSETSHPEHLARRQQHHVSLLRSGLPTTGWHVLSRFWVAQP